jgi:hypothetical protein
VQTISALYYTVFVLAVLSCSVSFLGTVLVLTTFGMYDSPLGANAQYCCNRFDWSHDLFILNLVELNNSFFYKWHKNNLTDPEFNAAWSLLDIILIRETYSVLPDNFTLTIPKLLTLLLQYTHPKL